MLWSEAEREDDRVLIAGRGCKDKGWRKLVGEGWV